jgi:hypothetical protein
LILNNYPIEVRVFASHGQIQGVSSYYVQRPLQDTPDIHQFCQTSGILVHDSSRMSRTSQPISCSRKPVSSSLKVAHPITVIHDEAEPIPVALHLATPPASRSRHKTVQSSVRPTRSRSRSPRRAVSWPAQPHATRPHPPQ